MPYGAHRGGWRATRPRAQGGRWLRGSRRLELVVEMAREADAWERAQRLVQLPLWSEEARRAA